MTERKLYLDNIRTIAILLLFPYHILMIYNSWGFYLHGKDLLISEIFNQINWIWMMPTLFAIAGMSSKYALARRSIKEYIKERVNKLLIPLIFGLLLIIPVQSFIADLHFKGEANYLNYFTKLTTFEGYDGAFTPGQLWFILFLFVISIVSVPFMAWYMKKGKGTLGDNTPLVLLVLMGILPCIGNEIFDISGKSPTEYLVYFLIGFFFLSNDKILEKLDKNRFILLIMLIVGATLTVSFNYICFEAVSWFAILTVIGIARHYLNYTGKISTYLTKSSFGVYVFHQSWIVILGYFILKLFDSVWVQIPLLLFGSVCLTYLTNEIARRTPITRWMFGLKK